MTSAEVLIDAYERVQGIVRRALDGLSADELAARVAPDANSIAWLVWHLSRVQDDHLAHVAGTEQVWIAEGFVERFGLPFEPGATGFGHSSEEVAAVRVDSPGLLAEYHDAVFAATAAFCSGLTDTDLSRVVDTSYNPPVTLGVRLVSVIADNLQHAGQAAYVRGIIRS